MSVFAFPRAVNERAARTVAAAVAVLSVVSIVLDSSWLPWLLAGGFLLRVGWGPRFSPLARLAVWFAPRLGPAVMVPGAPKRFAQAIGAAVTVSAALLVTLGLPGAPALLAVLALFATLESVFAFCFGCWAFARLQSAGWLAAEACEVCAPADVSPEQIG